MPFFRIGGGLIVHLNYGSGKRRKKAPPACQFFVTVKGERQRCLQIADRLCDWLGCDVPMCSAHALELGENIDVCPTHNAYRGLFSRLLPAPTS